eukprot:TRINITY_DN14389_c0_g3_i1.p1 TRINITY_DN14389_c0_g3~~TRINITY_DN14389_c0_g3_i1.p1  ORF type:complete len:692 (+),score=168.66 TRINITY_DN14389_c0_g3_i1:374-2449(+)
MAGHLLVEQNDWTQELADVATLMLDLMGSDSVKAECRGRTVQQIAKGKSRPWKQWAEQYGAYLGRYRILGAACHLSSTSTVWEAKDMSVMKQRVALKVVSDVSSLKLEVEMRAAMGDTVHSVIPMLRVHIPASEPHLLSEEVQHLIAEEHTEQGGSLSVKMGGWYVMAMPWAHGSLSDEMRMKRVAGLNVLRVKEIALDVAVGLDQMHRANLIHGDVKPKNIVKPHGSGWLLIDLDASAQMGQPRAAKYSEGYAPPDWYRELLPFIRRPCSQQAEQPSILAHARQDIWQFGCLLYELCTAQDLFQKDINDDSIAHEPDRELLAHWTEPNDTQLDLVFKHALVSPARRLAAQDLIALCLQGVSGSYGAGHPNQYDRPQSMAQVLEHAFFREDDLVLPRVPYHVGSDVIISYSSTQVMHMKRLSRCLRAMGINAKDGSQVPPGSDWRKWYFKSLEDAAVFVPMLSKQLANSPACFEECRRADALKMPVVAAVVDRHGWQEAATQVPPAHAAMFGDLLAGHSAGCVPALEAAQGDFFDNFFENLLAMASLCTPHLHKQQPTAQHAVLLCAPEEEDTAFATHLAAMLQSHGLVATVASHAHQWESDCDTAAVLLPVLSCELFASADIAELILKAQRLRMSVVPIRFKQAHFNLVTEGKALRAIPFITSVLNCANRIPASEPVSYTHLTLPTKRIV